MWLQRRRQRRRRWQFYYDRLAEIKQTRRYDTKACIVKLRTNLFFAAVLDVGKAFRFLGGSDVGAGVARGLEVFAFVVLLLPNTLLIARSAACPLLAVLLFSTFRRLDGGLPPFVVAAPEMPRPTGVAAASAVFRDLLPPPCDFFVFSGFCLLCSWSSASES